MNIVIIVQARMTSTRLPGKVLKKVLGKPLLEYQLERLSRVENADGIVIATTTNHTDDPVVELCQRLQIPFWRGAEEDVLARYYEAANYFRADVVVRVTADCPVIDPAIVRKAIACYMENKQCYDYVRLENYPRGLDTEVFPASVLADCYHEASAQPDREHVTPFIYRHPERYRVKKLYCKQDYSHHRWTVDTPEDFELIRRIIAELYSVKPEFGLADMLAVIAEHPYWCEINKAVQQKTYGQ
ncbi:glycosyltransferase family protein|uniref:Spore coat polysaccharide biosynthesis protein SpsF n=1 Tax=Dendrosporobacter quercicolus TaxID=146817 RepID=A0A1G9WV88_9FIRM|nr:glycosyltransferase family protein [Dendrosporobacter quercicolus]NSL49222.1 glycosyltransferase family protein [Dendrosporobacter quercicolus DSM 1736]SDM88319.1 spore coat polysaccharide biosynthesis protein SpsF [Dendrosporobacter quercicolus]